MELKFKKSEIILLRQGKTKSLIFQAEHQWRMVLKSPLICTDLSKAFILLKCLC